MLKRQRPASPPPVPTFSETPFITDPVDLSLIERHHKKRRVLPPSLDGTSRGWAKPHEHHIPRFDDDDEEYYESDDEHEEAPGSSRGNNNNGSNFSSSQQQAHYASPYKSTNQLLRELHTVNQHRLLFSSPAHNLSLASQQASGSGSQQQQFGLYHSSSLLSDNASEPMSHHPSNSLSGFGHNSEGITSPRRQEWHRSFSGVDKEDAVMSNEVSRVTERYESTNRLLGSLFLSRRRQLEPLEDNTEHLSS
ncbi:hypothetical protein CVT24_006060 [Panaeolus cyanescens]|uniref:Uncharacterized protein n=1 Tax=Panaeolus cyanescens TaxID=181874 RepID=A0A409YDX5_9AGAR|nr:hypothetical protein CVT24_006060 [Panaeolus cyanescens]